MIFPRNKKNTGSNGSKANEIRVLMSNEILQRIQIILKKDNKCNNHTSSKIEFCQFTICCICVILIQYLFIDKISEKKYSNITLKNAATK